MNHRDVHAYIRGNILEIREWNAYPSIMRAALVLFADRGVAATSIRMIADLAHVSPGLVQHHFRTKERLRGAVDSHVRRLATAIFGDLSDEADTVMLVRELRAFEADHPLPLRYLARAIADREPGSLDVLETYVELAARFLPIRAARDLVMRTLAEALFGPALDQAWSSSPRRWTRIRLVEPTVPGGEPATTTTRSPVW